MRPLHCALCTALIGLAALWALPTSARAQLYVAQGNTGLGTVGEYNAATGAAINANLVTGLSFPNGLAVSGNTLFVVTNGSGANGVEFGAVGEYDATTGTAMNPSFITFTGLNVPLQIALSGNDLFVTRYGYPGYGAPHGTGTLTGKVGEYDVTTGAAINADLVTGLNLPSGLAVSGNTLFVTNESASIGSDTVGEYNATTGAAINASFITGLTNAIELTVSGNALFVTNFGFGSNTVGAYDATTGAAINASFITGLSYPIGLAVAPPAVPEASPWWMMAGSGAALLAVMLRKKRRAA